MKPQAAKLFVLLAIFLLSSGVGLAQSGRKTDTNSGTLGNPRPADSGPRGFNRTAVNRGTIPSGTVIELSLNESLSSKTAKKGDTVYLKLAEPVIINDLLIIGRNTSVRGYIINAESAGRKGKNGTLTIGFEEMTIDNGQKLQLKATLVGVATRSERVIDEGGEGKINDPTKRTNTAGTVINSTAIGTTIGAISGGGGGAITGAGIGAGIGVGSVLLTKGREILLISGSRMQIRLDSDLVLGDNANPAATVAKPADSGTPNDSK
jgi:hypothetical protein